MPRPGDLIFTYSGTLDAVGSCLLQRTLFANPWGPWYSHVAVVASHNSVIEASSEPEEDDVTWSGVKLQSNGVRLQLLPDLIFSAARFVALRHPRAAEVESHFLIEAPHVAAMYGQGYSIKALIAAAEQANGVTRRLVPKSFFKWKAEPDEIAQELRAKPEVRAEIEKHLPAGDRFSVVDDYFCSQLAGLLLFGAKLIDEKPNLPTPCGLYDELMACGWRDVSQTDYGAQRQECWKKKSRSDWQFDYSYETKMAEAFRRTAFELGYLGAAEQEMNDFKASLDAVNQKLIEMCQKEPQSNSK